MAGVANIQRRDQSISIRASRERCDLIDRVARAVRKSRSNFMIEAASREAEDVLLNRVVFR